MRRIPFPTAALAVGLVVLLTGCAGETPTSPASNQPPGGPGGSGGTCTVAIAMVSTSQAPVVGSEVVVRASITKGAAALPDGSSVQFTTDLGVFAENGLPTVSKTSISGNADVTLFSSSAGPAHVKATFECGSGTITVTFSGSSSQGPFIASFSPLAGSCAGGDTVTISGGLFGTTAGAVYFGGAPGAIQSWAANTDRGHDSDPGAEGLHAGRTGGPRGRGSGRLQRDRGNQVHVLLRRSADVDRLDQPDRGLAGRRRPRHPPRQPLRREHRDDAR